MRSPKHRHGFSHTDALVDVCQQPEKPQAARVSQRFQYIYIVDSYVPSGLICLICQFSFSLFLSELATCWPK